MRDNFRAFVRRGIPFMDFTGLEKPLAERISIRSILLLFLYAILLAVLSSFLLFGMTAFMNMVPTYCGLPGISRDLPEHNMMVLITPVVTALILAGILGYASSRASRVLRPFQGLLMINAGIPLGLEGPVADLPFSVAENENWPVRKRRILAAAGMTGGLAFLFGAPLMAVALAIELLVTELTWIGITAIALSSLTGILLHDWLIGSGAIFTIPAIPAAGFSLLLGYTAAGILLGLLAMLARNMIHGTGKLFQRLPFDKRWWPVVAAIIIGITGYYTPAVVGAGYEHIDSLLLGKVTLQFLLVMVVGKLVLMSVAVGSGLPGGTMAPLIVSGGAAGLFITFILQFAFPALHLNFAVAALVGMSAMFAAGNRVLPSAIFFAIETTHAVNALLPVICACTAAYAIVFLLTKKKIAAAAVG
jgi:chloride channel protein, CIC family